MPAPVHPGRLLRRELKARELSANRLALDLGVPSGRITGILNERRWISADTAFRLGRYFGNRRNSGSTCKANTISRLSSGSAAQKSKSASARRTPRDRSYDYGM